MTQDGEKVVLNVYDLSQGLARQLSTSLLGKSIDGIWHTGVVVYGTEYYFGGGIQRSPVGQTPYGKPFKVVEMGFTQVPKEVFEEYLNEISPRYTQATYNVLRHNCNNFSEEISQFLVGSGIPQDILGLPDEVMNSPFGGMLLPMINQLESSLKHNQAPAMPQTLTSSGVPDFSTIQLPSSAVASFSQASTAPVSSTVTREVAPPATVSIGPKSDQVKKDKGVETKAVEKTGKKGPAAEPKQDGLGVARAKMQEEITREFMGLMASGSLRASEAAALAARRVMARHGIAST